MTKNSAAKAKKAAPSPQRERADSPEDRCTSSTKRNGSSSNRETNRTDATNGNAIDTFLNGKEPSPTTKPLPKQQQRHSKIGCLARCFFLDMPLLLLFTLYVGTVLLHHVYDTYLVPQAELMMWTDDRKTSDITYYDRACTVQDISANSTDELVMTLEHSPEERMHHMAKHGVSLYPNVLSEKTADELRKWIVQHNKIEDNFYVISGEHRFTFGIGVNQAPIISKALHEIATNELFRPAIEKICGDNPAVIEFTAITSEFGAADQFWHQDTLPLGSSFKHARTFVPSYSLFIPLQDTSAEIGATEICPGSHVCTGQAQFCVEGGFRASGEQNVWPKATGALVNQHLFHRGMAHTDPNGLDRVLFILTFSPRPRMNKGEVETRLISMGGSYSIHWRQWGHALNDFGNARTAMTEPWKTMRSLGLYKPKNVDWGWDMPSVASMRIINDDNGYHISDLEAWLVEKGGFQFLPEELQAEFDEEEGWPGFLKGTLLKCEKASEKVYFIASGVYLSLFLAMALYQKFFRKEKGGSPFRRAIIRVMLTHAVVVLLACYAVYSVSNTQWAKNIHYGREYRLPITDFESLADGMLPGTLPNKRDVLAETKYESEYLYGTRYIIENAHPGNINFMNILVRNSIGYEGLSPALKAQLTSEIVEWVGQDAGRFLTQNAEGNWAEMPAPAAQKVVHKDIIKLLNPLKAKVLTEVAYLQSETKYGVLRDMAIHCKHIPDMLSTLTDKILDPPPFVRKTSRDVTTSSPPLASSQSSLVIPAPSMLHAPTLRENVAPAQRLLSLPPRPMIEEPYPCAWAKEGDVVEAKYKGLFNEWYRGIIVDLNVDTDTYVVQYDDDEIDDSLCRRCIRPYVPLKVDEEVDVRDEATQQYYSGRVVNVYGDDTVDVETYDKGLFERVEVGLMTRRSDPEPEILVGSHVEVLYQGGNTWYGAVVERIHAGGTFDVAYDDGDSEFRVDKRLIRAF